MLCALPPPAAALLDLAPSLGPQEHAVAWVGGFCWRQKPVDSLQLTVLGLSFLRLARLALA